MCYRRSPQSTKPTAPTKSARTEGQATHRPGRAARVLTPVLIALASGASLNAAAPPAAHQPLTSPAVAPLSVPPHEEEDYLERLLELLRLLHSLLGGVVQNGHEGPEITAEQWMERIRSQYEGHGLPPGLTPQQRANGKAWITEIRWLMPQLPNTLDPQAAASFGPTLDQIYMELGG